jgi:signal peptidase II
MLVVIFLVILDQWSKYFFQHCVSHVILIPYRFELFAVWNKGLSWGILPKLNENACGYFLINCCSCVCLSTMMIYYYLFQEKMSRLDYFSFVLLISGCMGNAVDRLFLGAVCDFIHLSYGPYHFPAFNYADIYLTLACLLFMINELSDFLKKKNQ